MTAALRVLARSVVLLAAGLLLVPVQVVLVLLRGPRAPLLIPQILHRVLCATLGIRVLIHGTPQRDRQTVFVANHLSHLDIAVLGSHLRASFVAKDDIARWPLFGFLSRLQHTVFISRNRRDAGSAVGAIGDALARGHQLVLFPEGTTSDGSDVLPFKSSTFAPLLDPRFAELMLQPVTVDLLDVDGRSTLDGGERDLYAYHSDMVLLPHLVSFMRGSGATVALTFHDPFPARDYHNRKVLGEVSRARVRSGLRHVGSPAAASLP